MTAFKSFDNMFSSVAAMVAASSLCAYNIFVLGTAVAVSFFVLISIICTNIICGVVIINALLIARFTLLCKYSYKSKQQAAL